MPSVSNPTQALAAPRQGLRLSGEKMPYTPCEVADCDRPVYCRGRCSAHYNQLARRSQEGWCPCGLKAHSRGLCHSCLAADRGLGPCECGKPARYASSLECHACYTRRRYHEKKAGIEPTRGPLPMDVPLTYEGAHARVRRERGSASNFACFMCNAQAIDWALMHLGGPLERTVWYRDMEVQISPDPSDYAPLCRGCHGRLDRAAKRARTETK